jgi:hypothetical protein
MGYVDVWHMTGSQSLQGRLAAAAAEEQATGAVLDPPTADGWVTVYRWHLCAAPGWGDAWASAVAAGRDDPGADPSVITDQQILSQTQAVLAAIAA